MHSATITATSGPMTGGQCACCVRCCNSVGPCCWSHGASLSINSMMTSVTSYNNDNCTGTIFSEQKNITTQIGESNQSSCGMFCVPVKIVAENLVSGATTTQYGLMYLFPGNGNGSWNYAIQNESGTGSESDFDHHCFTAPGDVSGEILNPAYGSAFGSTSIEMCCKFQLNGSECFGGNLYSFDYDVEITGSNCCSDETGNCRKGEPECDGSCGGTLP